MNKKKIEVSIWDLFIEKNRLIYHFYDLFDFFSPSEQLKIGNTFLWLWKRGNELSLFKIISIDS